MARISKAPDVRRSEFIQTAQRFFYTKGYESTSISDIVRAMDVAKGTFYYYFDSKQAILEALIDDLVDQSLEIMEPIINDESLSTLEKWHAVFSSTAAWKAEHREELLAILQVMYRPENVVLQHKFRREGNRRVTPEIGKIIEQGVKEGVFNTPYPEEAAEIAYAVMQSASDYIADLLLHPGQHDGSIDTVHRKIKAIYTAVERVLGAPEGSLRLIDEKGLEKWFGAD